MHEGRSQSSQPERETMEKKRPGATTGKASASKETTPSSTEEETSEESRDNSSRTSGREEEKEHRSSSSSSPTGPLVQLMTRTGYNIYQQNGQRRYGPPPDWTGSPPRGCEVFVGKIPRDCLEDELVPVFEKAGPVYEMRLMMECNDLNRGYAFVVYCKATDAKKSVKMLNNYEIRKGRTLGVCMSVDNCRLFVGGIPKRVNKENIKEEMERVTEGVTDVIMYPSASDKTKNRGFAFVEYVSHRAAAMARRKLMNGRIQLWNHVIAVDWAEPELKVDEEIMAKVKVLYVRNLMLTTAESQITEAFSAHAPIERVKKIRDYAFIHFHTRNGALTAMEAMNGATLDGAVIEVTLAKPVDKESHARNTTRRQKSASPTIPSYSVLPIDYPLMSSLCFPPPSPKVISRNSLGAKVMRSPPNTKGKPRVFFPPLSFPQSHLVFPASPVHGPYMPQYMESPKRPQVSEEAVYDIVPGLDISPAHPHQAPPSQQSSLKQPRVPVQVLEELCIKSNWGQPLYCLHNATTTPEGQLFQYKVHIPALGTTYIPSKFCRSVDEAQFTAAEYALIQLGCPLEGSSYPPHAPPFTGVPSPLPPVETLAVAAAIPPPATYSHHPSFVGIPATSKTHPSRPALPTLSSDPTIFTGFEPTPFPVPPPHTLAYSPHAELYHRNF